MAVWGQGDPRWIVEERPDATNVNNWHWTEKNATEWSKRTIRDLLKGLQLDDPAEGRFIIKDVPTVDGEATANMRKGKLVFFYEWNVVAEFSGAPAGGLEEVAGKITVPNLSEENTDMRDVDVSVEVTTLEADLVDKEDVYRMRRFMNARCPAVVRQKLADYIRQLTQEYSKDLIKPTKTGAAAAAAGTSPSAKKPAPAATSVENVGDAMRAVGLDKQQQQEKPDDRAPQRVRLTETFSAPVSELFSVFVDTAKVAAWSQGAPDVYDPRPGGRFSLFGGNVTGEFREVDATTAGGGGGGRIVQTWRLGHWPPGHQSLVTLAFEQRGTDAVLDLTQEDVPAKEVDRTVAGWKTYYFDPIKRTFGFGALLFN